MPRDLFKVTESSSIQVVELTLPEQLDSAEFDTLNNALLRVFDGRANTRWIVDLAGVQHMGSAVLGLMVNIRQRIKDAKGRLVICNLSPRLREIFEACCLERLFSIAKTRDEALESLK